MAAHLLTVGDNVVDRYPQRGFFYPGGNAVNVAVHTRRLGAPAAYIGAVGTDEAGEVVLGSLRAEGVDTTRTRVVDGPNAYAVVQVVDGNRVFAHGDLGISVFELSEEDLAFAKGFEIVHTGECSNVEGQLGRLAQAAPPAVVRLLRAGLGLHRGHRPPGRHRHPLGAGSRPADRGR